MIEKIINRQLSPFYRTVETLKDKELFEFTVTPEEREKWIDWGANFIFKNSNDPKHRDRKEAQKEMCWIDYMYGLKIKGGWEAEKEYLQNKEGVRV